MRPTGTAARGGPQRRDATRQLLATLSSMGPTSRAELARRTGLAESTVSTTIGDLRAAGTVIELEATALPLPGAKGGRPAVLLALHRSAGLAIGIDIGKRHVRVAIGDLAHQVLAERTRQVAADRPAAAHIAAAATLVNQVLEDAQADRSHVVAVGMGLPGPVHRATGELGDSTILPGWVGVRAATAMGDALGLPVTVDNDANLGALAEWTWGAARGYNHVAYLKIATGIGAGLIIDGHPYPGAGGTAGELGHTVIDPAGPICRCGNRGCLEMLAGTPTVLHALRDTHGDTLTIGQAISLARGGDPGCGRAIADAGRAIGSALATLCNLLNPQRIVVGGELGAAGELLLTPLRESLQRGAIRSAAQDVQVVESTLGERAEVLGALALAMRNSNPLTRGPGTLPH
jgi:predicted NBD/HSP70 family sugar kinase/biotin operon repressor